MNRKAPVKTIHPFFSGQQKRNISNPPVADTMEAIQTLEVPDDGVAKATIRARSPPLRMTSIVALNNGVIKNWKVCDFFGYFLVHTRK